MQEGVGQGEGEVREGRQQRCGGCVRPGEGKGSCQDLMVGFRQGVEGAHTEG